MPPVHRNRSRRIAPAVLVVLLAAPSLAGCGDSPKNAPSTSTAAGKTTGGARASPPRRASHGRASATQRYARFAACMRRHGVRLPAANTSGKGPIFDTTGVDPRSAAFKAADRKCARELFPKRPTAH